MVISAKTTLVLTALALMAPAPALAAEIREQPADVERTDIVRVEWIGGPADQVVVEQRHGLWWVAEAAVTPEQEGDDVWSARWQPGRDAPSGTHRVRIETAGETLVSEEFQVRPCECVIPGRLRSKWRHGRFRLRLRAEYVPAGYGDFRLSGARVRTGRPVVRVLRDGRRIGSVRLRYRDGAFRGTWTGPRGPRASVVFRLVSLTDAAGNS
jgi:hypothetical protein